MLLVIGAWADYGTWRCVDARTFPTRLDGHRPFKIRPNILIFFTILSVGALFAWLGIQEPSKWPGAVVLYILTSKFAPFFRPFRVYLSQQYHFRLVSLSLLVGLSTNSLSVLFYVLVCCNPRHGAQSPGSSSFCR
jgi:hypothetical protein